MARISSGLTLSTDYFMRNFYTNNRDAIKQSGRCNFSQIELSYEDSRALSRATKQLMKSDYSRKKDDDSDIDDTLKATIEAYVKTYNNAVETASDGDNDTQRYLRQLKNLSKKYAEELDDIGISIENDGSLSINEDRLKLADTSKIRDIFSEDKEFSGKALSLCKKLTTAVQNNIFSQMTGNGLRINITL